MIVSGELWTYLWPSLIVLLVGLSHRVASSASRSGCLLARFWVLDVALGVYITFLYSTPTVALVPLIVLWAGFEIDRQDHRAVPVRVLPDGDQHLSGREERRSAAARGRPRVPLPRAQLWANIVLPGALPFIVTGLRLAVGRGLIGMVLADLYTAISGIGYLIVRTASTYHVDKMFVPIVTLGMLGVT